jgi:hypothetical protein
LSKALTIGDSEGGNSGCKRRYVRLVSLALLGSSAGMTGASVIIKEGPNEALRRRTSFWIVAREVGSSTSRSRPCSFRLRMRVSRTA